MTGIQNPFSLTHSLTFVSVLSGMTQTLPPLPCMHSLLRCVLSLCISSLDRPQLRALCHPLPSPFAFSPSPSSSSTSSQLPPRSSPSPPSLSLVLSVRRGKEFGHRSPSATPVIWCTRRPRQRRRSNPNPNPAQPSPSRANPTHPIMPYPYSSSPPSLLLLLLLLFSFFFFFFP
ncbi:hypothetical protein BZA05DRAFT_402209 [Tricharina praecox]|uniref:uncharacterized protein n=1 Tax=Tricharina praecox TaxID=43433 RepID=UPI00221FFF0F|nr:uncharacterized protein BZA05DRAFT_402209 [Tricharina praecox]KAI5849099.1 hypothetical protein BZA05DRAFT_402209 [Tricharina praecox]